MRKKSGGAGRPGVHSPASHFSLPTSHLVVPRLRFPKFREAADWTLGKASDIVEVLQGYGFPERLQGNKGGEFPFYKVSDISACVDAGGILLGDANNHIDANVMSGLRAKPMPVGATVFAKIGEAIRSNKRAITTRPSLVDNNAAGVKAITGLANDYFVYDLWCRVSLIEYAGGVVPAVNKSAIEQIPVCYPQPAEQQKIADCLTSLDEVIAAQGRKVDALKAHKRGLMQQLFPRAGETHPRLRFPEFRNAAEWRQEALGKLTLVVRGGSPRPIESFLTQDAEGLNWLKIGDVGRDAKYVTNTNEKVRPEALTKTRVIHPGDFILSNSMSFGRPYISTIKTCIHDGWIAVTSIPDDLSREFLYYSILSERSQSYFVDQAAGSGVQNLNKEIINRLQIGIPTEAEQHRIADCLSSLDTQITAETTQLAALRTHKRGLMQQLFPAPEAGA